MSFILSVGSFLLDSLVKSKDEPTVPKKKGSIASRLATFRAIMTSKYVNSSQQSRAMSEHLLESSYGRSDPSSLLPLRKFSTMDEKDRYQPILSLTSGDSESRGAPSTRVLEVRPRSKATTQTQVLSDEGLSNFDAELPMVRLVDMDRFRALGRVPRFPDDEEACTLLEDADLDHSLVVFVCHHWRRARPSSPGWSGTPHPDSADHGGETHALIVAGVDAIHKSFASQLTKCYLWIDFSCLNQNGHTGLQMQFQMRALMDAVDLVFSPVREVFESAQPDSEVDWYKGVLCKPDASAGLFSRAWCRLEMFHAALLPLSLSSRAKVHMFSGALRYYVRELGRRPHVVLSGADMRAGRSPTVLPPLLLRSFDWLDPRLGELTQAEDAAVIEGLLDLLLAETQVYRPGWSGALDELQRPEGSGTLRHKDYSVYTGPMVEGRRCGRGVMRCANGSLYTGDFEAGLRQGQGRMEYASGAVYEGSWMSGLRAGEGEYTGADGDVYRGGFFMSERSGTGCQVYVNGDRYEGAWLNDHRSGYGTQTFASGGKYEGDWALGQREGQGLMSYANGETYKGSWKRNMR